MGDPDEHVKHYTTEIDTSWIAPPYPIAIRHSLLVSGDRDLFTSDLHVLKMKYGAIAGDWESGAIAWVAKKNQVHCLILRGVTDLVGEGGGEAYNGNAGFYYENTGTVMPALIESLPKWLVKFNENAKIE
jgi:adenosylhomocysteine nucleosidase